MRRKGVACLYVRPDCLPDNLGSGNGITTIGGNQEFGLRAGTENVASIVGFGCAAEYAAMKWKENKAKTEKLRSRLLSQLEEHLGSENVKTNGPTDPEVRLPNTLSVGLKGIQSGQLLKAIGDKVAASSGATCHSSASSDCATAVSSVLRAMNVPTVWARGTFRFSIGPTTTQDEIDKAAQIIADEAKTQLAGTKN